MTQIPYKIMPIASGATSTSLFYMGKADQVVVWVSGVAANFASGVVKMTVESAPLSGVSSKTAYFYDYGGKTPAEAAITISTGGVYEIPNGGGMDMFRVSFDVAASAGVQLYIGSPKTTF